MHRKFDTILHPDQMYPALTIWVFTQVFICFTSLSHFYCSSNLKNFAHTKSKHDYLIEKKNDDKIKAITLISHTVFVVSLLEKEDFLFEFLRCPITILRITIFNHRLLFSSRFYQVRDNIYLIDQHFIGWWCHFNRHVVLIFEHYQL